MNCERENYDEAQREKHIEGRQLAREILPLLKENFVAVCRLREDEISMKFPNGQRATVAVWFDEETKNEK